MKQEEVVGDGEEESGDGEGWKRKCCEVKIEVLF